jgi:hypothetical protein
MKKKPADSPRRPFACLKRLFREPGFFDTGLDQRGTSKANSTEPTAEAVAEIATRNEDVSSYITNKFIVVRPVRRVSVPLTQGMLRELDARAARMNISRQAVIKTLLDRALSEERSPELRPRKKAEIPRG